MLQHKKGANKSPSFSFLFIRYLYLPYSFSACGLSAATFFFTRSAKRFDVCQDLGYKASDILQSNAIIWVEGPSDRIYLQHWIKSMAPELREGSDFSIMFYGGRLLSHLHMEDGDSENEDVQSLIAVRQLNRHMAVVIDSDKDCKGSSILTSCSWDFPWPFYHHKSSERWFIIWDIWCNYFQLIIIIYSEVK